MVEVISAAKSCHQMKCHMGNQYKNIRMDGRGWSGVGSDTNSPAFVLALSWFWDTFKERLDSLEDWE